MHSYGQVTISSHRGGVVITEAVYTWLKQVITFYIISSLLINVVVSDKYKDYIRMITVLIHFIKTIHLHIIRIMRIIRMNTVLRSEMWSLRLSGYRWLRFLVNIICRRII